MGRHGPHVLGMQTTGHARTGPRPTTQTMGEYQEMSIFNTIKAKAQNFQTQRTDKKFARRLEKVNKRERDLDMREKEAATDEREHKINQKYEKMNTGKAKGNAGSALGSIMGGLESAFGQPQSSGGRYAHSNSSRNMGPLIPDPLSNNPYGPPTQQHKKHNKSKSKGKSGGQNIHIHIDK